MGCTQSKIENEEIVNRCKERKTVMKESVSARNAFAAAHFSYAAALKNTGAALSDYAQGEVEFPDHRHTSAVDNVTSSSTILPPAPPQPPYETLPPPPPPPIQPLQRASTMPEFSMPSEPEGEPPELNNSHSNSNNNTRRHPDPIIEEDDDESDEDGHHGLKHRSRSRGGGGGSVGGGGGGGGRGVSSRREGVKEDLPPPTPPQPLRSEDMSMNMNKLNRAEPPPPHGMSSWDYFFPSMETVAGSSLDEHEIYHESSRFERKEMREVREEEERRRSMGHEHDHDEMNGSGGEGEEEDEEEEVGDTEVEDVVPEVVEEPPPPPPKVVKKVRVAVPVPTERRAVGKGNLLEIFTKLDDCFLQASESANEVSKMLEANRLHYHSNFADNRGHIDHSARVMRVITWNRSFKGLPEADLVKDDFDSEESETHATVLDKMLAWEKKLYDEVKAGEQMKLEYQKKIASLNRLKKRGASTDHLERTKATVSHLHTRYIVDMQSMDSTVSEINRLRDEQLYPKLVQLVDGMAIMWENMRIQHDYQSTIVQALRSLDISHSPKETSEHHFNNTHQLHNHVQIWHSQFEKLMLYQKEYIKFLNNWLKLNLIPIDNNLREKVSSPERPQTPPIQILLRTWHDFLEKLPEEGARTAIHNFAAVMDTIYQYQNDEMKMKERCEETRRDLTRKVRKFEDWYNKYMQKRTDDEMENDKDVIAEQQITVELLKKRLEEEEESYQRQCIQVRDKSLMNLKTGLPEVFRAMSEFSRACSHMYKSLRSRAQPQQHSNASMS